MRQLIVIILLSAVAGSCSSPEPERILTQDQLNRYLGKGTFMTSTSQQLLGSNLMMAIREKGTAGALDFCNVEAQALTDSMSVEVAAMVKRVTDQPRNPVNMANEEETEYINEIKKVIRDGEKLYPAIRQDGQKVIAYYPIIANALCMQCHGDPETDITPETLTMIKQLYPDDKATGYATGDLRGIWVVEMDTTIHRL